MKQPLTLVLVGANGYVGRSVLQQTAAGPEHFAVRAQVRNPQGMDSPVTLFTGSLEQVHPQLFPDSPHVLVHVAGKNIDHDGSGYRHTNVVGTANLLKHCNQHTRGIIYNSSLSVLGQGAQRNAANTSPQAPQTALAKSRAEAESMVMHKAAELGITAYCLRPRFVLGKEDAFVVPALRKLVARGLFIGDGNQQFSVIDVADYARLILELCSRITDTCAPEQMALNVGYQQPLPFASIYTLLQELEPGATIKRRLRHPSVLAKALNLMPIGKLNSLATQLQLIGLDHYGDISETRKRLHSDLLSRNSYDYFRELAQHFKDSPCN